MKALLLGATGLVGRHVLRQLLAAPAYTAVRVLARRPPEGRAPAAGKLELKLADLAAWPADSDPFWAADHVYCCLGTTIQVAGSREAFRRVDHDAPARAAHAAARAGARKFLLVSSVGANAGSRNFYLRTKGETERDIAAAGIAEVHAFRPSFLLGERGESRPAERVGIAMFKLLVPALAGPLRIYRPIEAAELARQMLERGLAPERPGTWCHQGRELGV
jgi:uncharacterized protein YbjT (DUF2867 family)